MADNDVTIVVDAKNRTATAFGAAAKGAKTVGDVAAAAGRQVKDMGDKLDAAQTRARQLATAEERAAEKARRMAQDLALLRRQLEQSGDSSGELGRKVDRLETDLRFAALATEEYRHSANRAAADAREQARAYDRVADNARQAARAVALLGAAHALTPEGGGKGGLLTDFSSGFLKGGFGGATSAVEGTLGTPVLGPALLAAGAAAGVGIAPFAGGVAGGAALLGGAAGGAGLGLAAAWMGDPEKYGARWNKIIADLKGRWLSNSGLFVKPLEDGLKEVDRVIRDLPIEKIMAVSSGFAGPLIQGAGGGVTAAANGFADFLASAQPVVDVVGPKLTSLGNDVGDALRAIGMGADGGAKALGDFVDAAGYAIQATGIFIGGLEKAYEAQRKTVVAVKDFGQSVPVLGDAAKWAEGQIFGMASTTIVAGRALHDTADAADAAKGGVQGLGMAFDEVRAAELKAADASLGLAQGWLDLNKELKDGKRTLDLNTQAGIDHQQAILSQVEAAERLRERQVDLTGDVDAANATYAENIERIRQQAYALGYNKQLVDALINSIAAIPPTKTTDIKTPGMGQALADGISLGNALNNIDGTYTAYVRVAVSAPPGISVGNLLHHAAGGPTSAGWSAVNDWGGPGTGEIIRAPDGSMVIPAGTGRQMMRDMASAGGGGGGRASVVELRVTGHGALYEVLMQAQRSGELQILSSAIV